MNRRHRIFVAIAVGMAGFLILTAGIALRPFLAFFLARLGFQEPIHCWVRVVDQEGKGVGGWKCRIVEDRVSLWPFSKPKSVVKIRETDETGTLEYTAHSSVSGVFFGYNSPPQWRLEPTRLVESQYLGVTVDEFSKDVAKDSSRFAGSRENPYIMHVFRVGPPRRLLFWQRNIKLERYGNYACIDVLSGRVWESAEPQGDIALADGIGTHEHQAPCRIIVKAGPHCALFPVVDDWGLGPPADGYLKELCWDKDWQERRRWTYNTIQIYYWLEGDYPGMPFYGRLSLGLSPYVQGAQIELYTNLQGERNLFYDGYVRSYDPLPGPIRDFVSPPVH